MSGPGPTVVASLGEPNMEIVHKLEELLAQAVNGEIRGFASVSITKGSVATTGWIIGTDANMHMLHSGAQILAHRMAADMQGDAVTL